MNIYHRCPLPMIPNIYARSNYVADLNGTTWSAGGESIAGAVQFIQDTFPADAPVTVDGEIADVTNSPERMLDVLKNVRAMLPKGRKLIASVKETNDIQPMIDERFASMVSNAAKLAPYCDGFKLGVYCLGADYFARDLERARLLPLVFSTAFRSKLVWPEVWARFECFTQPDGKTSYGGGAMMTPEQLGQYAQAVTVGASACVVFEMSWLAGVFAWV